MLAGEPRHSASFSKALTWWQRPDNTEMVVRKFEPRQSCTVLHCSGSFHPRAKVPGSLVCFIRQGPVVWSFLHFPVFSGKGLSQMVGLGNQGNVILLSPVAQSICAASDLSSSSLGPCVYFLLAPRACPLLIPRNHEKKQAGGQRPSSFVHVMPYGAEVMAFVARCFLIFVCALQEARPRETRRTIQSDTVAMVEL